jgi:hypothetical protein
VAPVLKGGKTVIPDAAIASVKKNTVALKGACPYYHGSLMTYCYFRASRHSEYVVCVGTSLTSLIIFLCQSERVTSR